MEISPIRISRYISLSIFFEFIFSLDWVSIHFRNEVYCICIR